MLPKFAAIVSMTIINITLREPMHFKNIMVSGTNVINVMSLVITIDEKNIPKSASEKVFLH